MSGIADLWSQIALYTYVLWVYIASYASEFWAYVAPSVPGIWAHILPGVEPFIVYLSATIIGLGVVQNLVYLFQLFLAYAELRINTPLQADSALWRLLKSDVTMPISLLVPAYNEAKTIVDSVTSLMALHYPNFEVIVVNDGSSDGTLAKMVEAFDLKPTSRSFPESVPHKPVRGLYASPRYPKLFVVDKGNGGKSDALNAGINLSRFPLFCTIDRFYSKKTNTFLFIGAAFLGTAFLDGYHTIVTSAPVASMLPSTLPSLIPWSWVASRMLLSFLLFASWLAWRRESVHGVKGRISERTVYASVALLTLLSFVFFALAPLPPAYYPNFFFHRPEEFLPALFFLLATIGYLTKGDWRHDPFEHWLVLSLIFGFVGQALFMSFSGQLFDIMFDVAHTLKKVSYALVLVGLTISMFRLFQRAEQSADNLRLANLRLQTEVAERERVQTNLRESELRTSTIIDSVIDGIITIRPDGIVESYNKAATAIFGYVEDEVLGKNVKMLMPEETAAQHGGFLTNYVETGEGGIIGVPREVVGQRSNGTTFPMELAVIDMHLNDGVVFVGMIRDITERKKVERMKNEFVSTVSHELRTPLTSIIGALGLVEGGLAGEISEKTWELIGIAARNSARLVRLIGDILNIEKIESGELEIDFQPIDLAQLVSRAITENTSYAAEFDVQISAAEIAEGAIIHGGEDQILQVLTNLISNAAKFAPPHSTVDISTQRLGGTIRTSVTDHGPGIPDEFRSRIFGKFTQADSSDTRRPGGTGLGLSICKALVERMGGTIGFQSEIGVGATFYFDLPEWDSSRQRQIERGAA